MANTGGHAAGMSKGGGIVKSNKTSSDNPLSFGSHAQSQQYTQHSPATNNNMPQKPAPNPGGITKSNYSSADNPLANSSHYIHPTDFDKASSQSQPSQQNQQASQQQQPQYYDQQQAWVMHKVKLIN